MSIPAVVSLVTLGVCDVEVATAFYVALGFEVSPASVPGEVSFLRTAGAILALWGEDDLRSDSHATEPVAPGSFRGVGLAINVADRASVDAALATAERAGARINKPASAAEWGGYQGYFTDPDGHLWEVAHNPGWPLDERGLPQLP